MTDADWWAHVRRQREECYQTAGPAQLALWRTTKARHVAEAVIWAGAGIGLELRYAPDGELRSSHVHRDAAALAADAHGKRSEMEAKGRVAA